MGRYALRRADMATNEHTGREERPAWKPEDYPVIKSFYKGSGPAKSTQYMTDVYDRMTEADQIYRTIRSYQKEGRKDEAKELTKENRDKLKARKALGFARQQLGSINKQMDSISRNESMSAEEKRNKLDKLRARKNKIAKKVADMTEGAF